MLKFNRLYSLRRKKNLVDPVYWHKRGFAISLWLRISIGKNDAIKTIATFGGLRTVKAVEIIWKGTNENQTKVLTVLQWLQNANKTFSRWNRLEITVLGCSKTID